MFEAFSESQLGWPSSGRNRFNNDFHHFVPSFPLSCHQQRSICFFQASPCPQDTWKNLRCLNTLSVFLKVWNRLWNSRYKGWVQSSPGRWLLPLYSSIFCLKGCRLQTIKSSKWLISQINEISFTWSPQWSRNLGCFLIAIWKWYIPINFENMALFSGKEYYFLIAGGLQECVPNPCEMKTERNHRVYGFSWSILTWAYFSKSSLEENC
jgi:hypothetical protein